MKYCLIVCFFFLTLSLCSLTITDAFPDNTEARLKMKDHLLSYKILSGALDKSRFTIGDRDLDVVFRIKRDADYYYYIFINGDPMKSSSEENKGNFSLKRSKDTSVEGYEYLNWKLKDIPGNSIRIFPEKQRSRMEIYLMDYPLYKDIILPVPFEKIIFYTFDEIVSLSTRIVDWDFLLFEKTDEMHGKTEEVVNAMRKTLPLLGDREDGSFNEKGEAVFIETGLPQLGEWGLNCSGFAKWVVDQFYFSLEGKYLSLDPLKEKQLEVRGHYWSLPKEDERDPYFGLDWTRNLAAMLYESEYDQKPEHPEIFDVRNIPYLRYVEDLGYEVKHLKMILYWLAVNRPGTFYLGSVNGLFGQDPVLRQHYHVTIFFPYISKGGDFHAIVMERSRETAIDDFVRRYDGESIHLVALETELQTSTDQ